MGSNDVELQALWAFWRDRWRERERLIVGAASPLAAPSRASSAAPAPETSPETLSERSPLFGIVDAAASSPAGRSGVGGVGGASKKESKRKGKGGKGGGAKGGGKDPGDADGEWFGERDAARSLRVSAGVWRALYPDVGEGQGPGENFLGERLLNWLYRDAHAYRERGSLGAESEEAKTRAVASADALLERNEALIAEALRTKATIRAMVDEILVLYGRVASPKAWRPGGLDPERPADVASFEARWRDWHALRRATTRLRARLYELDVAECEVELEDLERCEREWKETVRTIEARRKEVGHEAEAAKKKAAAASKGGKSAADRAAAALAARLEAMVEELEARHQMYMRRVGDSAHEHQCVSRAVRPRRGA